ncbi:hypothetical protein TWF481_010315 [Arthrobotrys musiformis]|uniref:Uncharacterized protein n=1 Tax=Arthrobotrys musiformis TaxID=47236 RepID=A0AAV9W3A2_9PEZI
MQALEKLKAVQQAENRRISDQNIVMKMAAEVKASLLFQFNWAEMLMSAPVAINCMGGCFIASSSKAASAQFPDTMGGKLVVRTLRGNLVQVSNLGTTAFLTADTRMTVIHQRSTLILTTIQSLMATLSAPSFDQVAAKNASIIMEELRQAAQDSCADAKAVDDKFNTWLQYVMDFHTACVNLQSTNVGDIEKNTQAIESQKKILERQEEVTANAKKTIEKFGEVLDETKSAFVEASKAIPGGWNLVGQDLARTLSGAVPGVISAAVTVGVHNLTGGAVAAVGTAGLNYLSNREEAKVAKAAAKPVDPPMYVSWIATVMVPVGMLKTILDGSNGGIDWKPTETPTLLNVIIQTLEKNKESVGGKAPDEAALDLSADDELRRIISVCLRVAKEIDTKFKDKPTPEPAALGPTDPNVSKWKKDFNSQYESAVKLQAVAKAMPGTPTNDMPTIVANPVATSMSKEDAETSRVLLESATRCLNIKQEALNNAQARYSEANTQLAGSIKAMGEIQKSLSLLEGSNVTLEAVQKVLMNSIKLIVTMKSKISQLVHFFSALAGIVEVTSKSLVKPFIDKTALATDTLLGGFGLPDFLRTSLFQGAITIFGQFSVFADIAKMWVQLSQGEPGSTANIMHGIALAEQLGVLVDRDDDSGTTMKEKNKELDDWAKETTAVIKGFVEKTQKKISEGLESRVKEISSVAALLPAPAEMRKAITNGTALADAAIKTTQKIENPIKISLDSLDDF